MAHPISELPQISEPVFPANGTAAEKLRSLLAYAVLAPSTHNTQPWRFTVAGDTLTLHADRTRALPVIDPFGRELILSCGAALFNLRVALRHFGYAGRVSLFPDAADPDCLACVELGEPAQTTDGEERLFASLPHRHTNRMAYSERVIADTILEALRAAVEQEGVRIELVPQGETRDALAELIVTADRDQMADPQFRRELARWLRPNGDHQGDGIPGYALGMPGLISYAGPFFVRTFDTGALTAARDRQIVTNSPLLLALHTATDTPEDWLKTGQALERLLLCATAEGISASFLNAPLQVTELRPQVCDLLGITGFPQVILRMGYGPEVKPTPRREIGWAVVPDARA